MTNRVAWKISIGVGLLFGFIGIPIIKIIGFIASESGWWFTLRGLAICTAWGAAIGLGVELLGSGLAERRSEHEEESETEALNL